MISPTPMVSRAKKKWYKPKKVKKLALNSQLLTVQILKNDVQVLIVFLSYFITTVTLFIDPLQRSILIGRFIQIL